MTVLQEIEVVLPENRIFYPETVIPAFERNGVKTNSVRTDRGKGGQRALLKLDSVY